jgi:hypothetical protein
MQLDFGLACLHNLFLQFIDLLPQILLFAVIASLRQARRQVLLFACLLRSIYFAQLHHMNSQLFPQSLQHPHLKTRGHGAPTDLGHRLPGIQLMKFFAVLRKKLPTHRSITIIVAASA